MSVKVPLGTGKENASDRIMRSLDNRLHDEPKPTPAQVALDSSQGSEPRGEQTFEAMLRDEIDMSGTLGAMFDPESAYMTILAAHNAELYRVRAEGENDGALAELRGLKFYLQSRRLKPEGLDAVLDYQIRNYEDALTTPKGEPKS